MFIHLFFKIRTSKIVKNFLGTNKSKITKIKIKMTKKCGLMVNEESLSSVKQIINSIFSNEDIKKHLVIYFQQESLSTIKNIRSYT